MNRPAEIVATHVAGLAAITLLIAAASPDWLPNRDLPPPLVYADALGHATQWLLDRLIQLGAWLESAFDSARFSMA
ncbi:hypothetical protein HFP89_12325 [Wenzhouxiangella sp. XN79A]|uniref:hypothetical protein n=1 Tax=Wenzhouxiangella sp. XN79A TaxID=2724193 RepID=UPI00144AD8B2|nr:hypothetical protein [Wenzhouxiangella sp. XN79A]NKI35949.1 hypothetical protein [Wenzhouxiangella sp. XN79A]